MKDYIEHSDYSTEEKEEMKKSYEHWADVALEGIKQRLRDSDKLHNSLYNSQLNNSQSHA